MIGLGFDAKVFALLCEKHGIERPEREFRFCERRWRFDYAWPAAKVALEVEGGVFSGGRHTRGAGFVADMEKYNTAVRLGWRVLRCLPEHLHAQQTTDLVRDVIAITEASSGAIT